MALAARSGDKSAFTELTERYRRELQVYCYRMLGSFDDSEDLVQETFLRAWRHRESFEGRSSLRSWLYRIATNGCLDFLRAKRERVLSRETDGSEPEVPWLQPYPDSLLEPVASDAEPEARALSREGIELAFLVALQVLPAKQRAALILCDALDWSAKEAASFLGMSSASVNSSLQRARVAVRDRAPGRRSTSPGVEGDAELRKLVERYVDAHERRDVPALAALLHEDLCFSMPPQPGMYVGREEIVKFWVDGGFGSDAFGDMRCVVTRSNGMPAVAVYTKKPGQPVYRPLALDVLRVENDRVAEITTFDLERVREWFGLPAELS